MAKRLGRGRSSTVMSTMTHAEGSAFTGLAVPRKAETVAAIARCRLCAPDSSAGPETAPETRHKSDVFG